MADLKNMKNNRDSENKKTKPRKSYAAPKIISHSAADIDKAPITVNACTSYIP